MESGLDGRNNEPHIMADRGDKNGLNGVRPRWPEQSKYQGATNAQIIKSQWSPA
ncbi:Uncharacterised protein [Arachnia propionica]|uniref:Uncharacterized protein n=1 Tax=Arachnia propionica TaxID=1750 RepID=A0A448N1P2_9ACTN|nr:Uncharacterised protein [Arachnia propionica]